MQLCTHSECLEKNKKLYIKREHEGDVILNGFAITEAQHHSALDGKSVILNREEFSRDGPETATLTANNTDLMLDGTSVVVTKPDYCVAVFEPQLNCDS